MEKRKRRNKNNGAGVGVGGGVFRPSPWYEEWAETENFRRTAAPVDP